MDELLTCKELAKRYKVSAATIRRLVQKGQLPGHKIGNRLRFLTTEVDKTILGEADIYVADKPARPVEIKEKIATIEEPVKKNVNSAFQAAVDKLFIGTVKPLPEEEPVFEDPEPEAEEPDEYDCPLPPTEFEGFYEPEDPDKPDEGDNGGFLQF